MAGPTIAELQLRLRTHGVHVAANLQRQLAKVGGVEIRRQLDAQARALLGIEKAAARANRALKGGGTSIGGAFSSLVGGMAKMTVAATGVKRGFEMIGSGVMSALKPAIDFEKTMSRVRIKGGREFTPGATKQLGESFKQNVRNGGFFTAQEQAEAAVELAASDLSPTAVQSMVPTVLKFAQGADIETGEAAKILTNIANMFKMDLGNAAAMEKLGSQIIKAANISTINVSDIFHTFKYSGTQANTANMDPAQLLAMTSVLGNRGVVASKAGTGTRNLFAAMARPPRRGKTAAKLLASIGLKQEDLQAGFDDMPKFLQELGGRYKAYGLKPAQIAAINSILFGQYGSTTSDILTKATEGGQTAEIMRRNIRKNKKGQWEYDEKNTLHEATEAIRNSAGEMDDAAGIAADTVAGRMQKLAAKWDLLKLSIGERFMPALERGIARMDVLFAKWEMFVTKNPDALDNWVRVAEQLAIVLPKAFENAATILKAMDPALSMLADLLGQANNKDGQRAVSEEDEANARRSFVNAYVKKNPNASRAEANQAYEERQLAVTRKSMKDAAAREAAAQPATPAGMAAQLTTPSVVNVKVGVDKEGQLRAWVDSLVKGNNGPHLNAGSSVTL